MWFGFEQQKKRTNADAADLNQQLPPMGLNTHIAQHTQTVVDIAERTENTENSCGDRQMRKATSFWLPTTWPRPGASELHH